MQYLINTKVVNGCMSPNYAHWGGLEAYWMKVTLTLIKIIRMDW